MQEVCGKLSIYSSSCEDNIMDYCILKCLTKTRSGVFLRISFLLYWRDICYTFMERKSYGLQVIYLSFLITVIVLVIHDF
jgi:hypothetical protein